jgi:hypothetical protein
VREKGAKYALCVFKALICICVDSPTETEPATEAATEGHLPWLALQLQAVLPAEQWAVLHEFCLYSRYLHKFMDKGRSSYNLDFHIHLSGSFQSHSRGKSSEDTAW